MCKEHGFSKSPHGEIGKTMQGSLPCLRADEPHGKALKRHRGACRTVRKPNGNLFLNV